MAVYVDPLLDWGWRLGPSCHLVADSLAELHQFAVSGLRLSRRWYQPRPVPHYDLTAGRRARAVALGAVELDRRAMAQRIRDLKERGCPPIGS